MRAVCRRELMSYFHTPVGYVFTGVFLALAGGLFYRQTLQALSGDLLLYLSWLTILLMLLLPVLTMRLLCEERLKKTDRMLFTSPLSLTKIVLGKYAAAAGVLLLTIGLTNVYVLVMALYGTVFPGEWFVGYLGLCLQGLAFLALDLLVTCFAGSQVTAAISAFAVNLVLWMADLVADGVRAGWLRDALNFVSLYERYRPFTLGQLSYASVLFFVSFIAVCLTVTVHLLDARRFGGGGNV